MSQEKEKEPCNLISAFTYVYVNRKKSEGGSCHRLVLTSDDVELYVGTSRQKNKALLLSFKVFSLHMWEHHNDTTRKIFPVVTITMIFFK